MNDPDPTEDFLNQEKRKRENGQWLPAYVETRSAPAVARRHPRDFTFYLGNPFPRFLLSLLNLPGTPGYIIRVHSCPFVVKRNQLDGDFRTSDK